MTVEYGIFDEEMGLLEGDFYILAEAEHELAIDYHWSRAFVAVVCPHHRKHQKDKCAPCAAELMAEVEATMHPVGPSFIDEE